MRQFHVKILSSLILLMVIFSGCGSEITAYRYSDYQVAERTRILILPFLDTRTFRDPADPLKGKIAERARFLFMKELRAKQKFSRSIVVAPELGERKYDYSLHEIKEFAEKYNCDLIFCGQVFSFTGTRAASIPPRAGLFVRAFSGKESKLVFVSESYNAAGVPGASGGRELQCSVAASHIINNFIESSSARTVQIKEASGTPTVLVLPFRERENPINLVEKNGGGAVVSSIYGMELAKTGKIQVVHGLCSSAAGYASELSVDDVLRIAKEAGADYVIRGQVVEFRRAQSVPSLWSAAISLSILAAQVMFAEVSGVDIAVEVYRVSDRTCIYAKRDISHQKYVVSAEKTVRTLASANASQIAYIVSNKDSQHKEEPFIDLIKIPETKEEIRAAAEKISDKHAVDKHNEDKSVVKTNEKSESEVKSQTEKSEVKEKVQKTSTDTNMSEISNKAEESIKKEVSGAENAPGEASREDDNKEDEKMELPPLRRK